MEEFILKMVLCLILAIVLGIVIGLLWSKLKTKKTERREEKSAGALSLKLKELESLYVKEQEAKANFEKQCRELKGELMQKTNLLVSTSETLKELQNKKMHLVQNSSSSMENLLKKKEQELLEFEEVLVKAEETISDLQVELDRVKALAE